MVATWLKMIEAIKAKGKSNQFSIEKILNLENMCYYMWYFQSVKAQGRPLRGLTALGFDVVFSYEPSWEVGHWNYG